MTHHIDYGSISWEDFEDICIYLWFDEGYKNIKPMGRRKEGGRDAIYIDAETGHLTIFQFKRWAEKYTVSQLKANIKEAARKVAQYDPEFFILNSAQKPNAVINDWVSSLEDELGFRVDYFDRSWVDLRLDNRRQDLRKLFFGIALVHHTWESMVSTSSKQVERTVGILSSKFSEETYVSRDIENTFLEFIASDRIAMAIVDSSGRGKTNTLCALAGKLQSQKRPVIFLSGYSTIIDDHGLERLACDALGYDVNDYQSHLRNASRLLQERGETCFILLDSVSETESTTRVNQSLKNLLGLLGELGCFKVCIACRDVAWPRISYGISVIQSYATNQGEVPTLSVHEYRIGDFSNDELNQALAFYSEKYNVSFTPLFEARNQLKHPLLLRLFCEAHQNQTLGQISSIPVANTYQLYLKAKTQSVSNLLGNRYNHKTIHKILRNVSGKMWHSGDRKFLPEEEFVEVLPANMSLVEKEELINALQEDGFIRVSDDPISLEGVIFFVFDALREYLLLYFLLSNIQKNIPHNTDIRANPKILLERFTPDTDNMDIMKLLSLIGMIQSEAYERREFLQSLLKWDFQTFCSCLSFIPPVGKFQKCNIHQLRAWAQELSRWYVAVVETVFDKIHFDLDPFRNKKMKSGDERVGIQATVSPECKEISYRYKLHDQVSDPSKLIIVKETPNYPTWEASLEHGTDRLLLHDPDHGFMIPVFPSPDGSTTRTINFKFPPEFAGESLNIPERRALFDVWYEVYSYVENVIFPRKRSQKTETGRLKGKGRGPWVEMQNDELSVYLTNIFSNAHFRYNEAVGNFFPNLRNVLNLSAQYPCYFVFATDRVSVRYAFIPVDSEEKITPSYAITDTGTLDIADPKVKLLISEHEQKDGLLHEQFVIQELKKLNKYRSPLHPTNVVEPIGKYFGEDSINDLAREWLRADLRAVFGF